MIHHLITTGLDDLMEEEKADEDIEGGKDKHHHGNKHLLCARAVEFIQKRKSWQHVCIKTNIRRRIKGTSTSSTQF